MLVRTNWVSHWRPMAERYVSQASWLQEESYLYLPLLPNLDTILPPAVACLCEV